MGYLLVSLLALAVGPLLVSWARRAPSAAVFVDAFVVVVIGGFVLLHVMPNSLAAGGWPAFVMLLVGVLAPLLVDRGLRLGRGGFTRGVIVILALVGLGLHAAIDGMALSEGSTHLATAHGDGHAEDGHAHGARNALLLVWAVLLHRIPVGVSIWWILPRTLGVAMAVVTLLVTASGTVVGFALGPSVLTGSSMQGIALFEALLCGSLLHVILHAHIPPPEEGRRRRWQLASFCGLVTAVGVIVAVLGGSAGEPSSGAVFVGLALESAPALLFAYLAIGAAHAFVPSDWFARATRGSSLRQALRGVAIGIPLPLCSCGIVPIYRDLIVRGSSVAAAVSFLIATPELEIAAVLLTIQLMGMEIAIARVLAAAVLAIGVGLLLGAVLPRPTPAAPPGPTRPERSRPPLGDRFGKMFRFGFGEAVDHTATWLLAGLGLSALVTPYLDPARIAAIPAGLDVPIAALIGLPVYVCASGSTPLAAVLIAQGLSPGAALAFLMTGPATNVTTFGVLSRLHGRGAALLFAIAALVCATGLGYLVNVVLGQTDIPTAPIALGDGRAHPLQVAALGVLTAVFVASVLRQGTRGFIEQLFITPASEERDGCDDDDDPHSH